MHGFDPHRACGSFALLRKKRLHHLPHSAAGLSAGVMISGDILSRSNMASSSECIKAGRPVRREQHPTAREDDTTRNLSWRFLVYRRPLLYPAEHTSQYRRRPLLVSVDDTAVILDASIFRSFCSTYIFYECTCRRVYAGNNPRQRVFLCRWAVSAGSLPRASAFIPLRRALRVYVFTLPC